VPPYLSHFWPVTARGYSVPGNHPVRPTCPRPWRLSSAKRSVARSQPLGSQAPTLPDSLSILSGATTPRQRVRYSLVLISEMIPQVGRHCQALRPILPQIPRRKKASGRTSRPAPTFSREEFNLSVYSDPYTPGSLLWFIMRWFRPCLSSYKLQPLSVNRASIRSILEPRIGFIGVVRWA
jgi:hypothetical protein